MDSVDSTMFENRTEAGRQLAQRLKSRALRNPLVLAIPRGGVATGLPLAQELGAELDVVLSRKLRAPDQPEYAIGAISEDGRVVVNPDAWQVAGVSEEYIEDEKRYQLAEIWRRRSLIRSVRPAAGIADRSVIVTDDGIATGSTMIAALRTVRTQRPYEVIVAVPVAAPDRLSEIRRFCDDVICLLLPASFYAVGQFYEHFEPVEDTEVLRLLREGYRDPTSRANRLDPA